MANAENNHDMDVSRLYVAECLHVLTRSLQRIRPRAQGRAYRVLKELARNPRAKRKRIKQ